MSLLDSMNIVGSAMTAERFRMDIALQNMANANTTRTPSGEPYRRKQVVFQERAIHFDDALRTESARVEGGGVRVTRLWRASGILSRSTTRPIPMPTKKAMS